MKTITAQQAVEQFEEFSRLAHDGEKILVTREGRPWVVLAPPVVAPRGGAPETPLEWPDFEAHWNYTFRSRFLARRQPNAG